MGSRVIHVYNTEISPDVESSILAVRSNIPITPIRKHRLETFIEKQKETVRNSVNCWNFRCGGFEFGLHVVTTCHARLELERIQRFSGENGRF
jgi:hypothetical protein